MSGNNRKKPKGTVPEEKKAKSPAEPNPLGYPFYALNESAIRLDSFARYAAHIEKFKRMWTVHFGDVEAQEDFSLAWIWAKEPFSWLFESNFIRWVAVVLAKGDVDALQRITDAYKMYKEGWGGFSNKDLAKVHMMIACNSMWEEGRDRNEVTKGEIEKRARRLWAESVCRRKHQDLTPENINRQEKHLPQVDWPLIRKEIGLDDLRSGKAGRKAIGNKKG
jgi:hypothetical protein